MERIPIAFEHGGISFSGYFGEVAGAGSNSVWHLYDTKNFYYGRLRQGPGGWTFDEGKGSDGFKQLAEYFYKHISLYAELKGSE